MPTKTIYSPEYRHLVERLRRAREDRGLSQVDLARTLGWPQQRLSAVEIGSRRLDVLEYFRLTDAIGLTPRQALRLVQNATQHG